MDEFDRGVFFLDLSGKKGVREPEEEETPRYFSPSTDIFETKEGVHIVMELPGVEAGSVTVEVSGTRLTVKGKKEQKRARTASVYLCMERRYGPFRRDIEIHGPLNTLGARATYKSGILKIFMERCEEKRGKETRVAISVEED